MPIYPSRRALFVHIPKTAGMSIAHALKMACGNSGLDGLGVWDQLLLHDHDGNLVRRLRHVFPINTLSNFPQQHLPASVLSQILTPEVWASHFKFAFVRNPWAMLLSMYVFLQHLVGDDDRAKLLDPDRAEQVRRVASFEQFVRSYAITGTDMSAMIVDESGNNMMDYVGRVESIDEDFAHICNQIGISVPLTHINSSEHGDYREYYTAETRAIVGRIFARDIEAFGYTF